MKSLVRFLGAGSAFLNGFFQADRMQIRSFGEKPLIFGVKRGDGRVFETPLREKANDVLPPVQDGRRISSRGMIYQAKMGGSPFALLWPRLLEVDWDTLSADHSAASTANECMRTVLTQTTYR